MKKMKLSLLPRIIIAIALGIVCGLFFSRLDCPDFLTVNSLFVIPEFYYSVIDIRLGSSGIADLGKGAGRLLLITALLAYGLLCFQAFYLFYL